MPKIVVSVCSRSNNPPSSLIGLVDYFDLPGEMSAYAIVKVALDAKSIYEGHQANLKSIQENSYFGKDLNDTIVVLCHDDIEMFMDPWQLVKYLKMVQQPGVGFIGVAGSTIFDREKTQGAWWNARHFGLSRGFVFQGSDPKTMIPNYFGQSGKVTVLDGCFMACSYNTLMKVGLEKPSYLSSGWDFYDIHLTSKAFLQGLNNYTVPIVIRHDSPGELRSEWIPSRDEFFKHHAQNLPLKIPYQSTNGLPL